MQCLEPIKLPEPTPPVQIFSVTEDQHDALVYYCWVRRENPVSLRMAGRSLLVRFSTITHVLRPNGNCFDLVPMR